MIFPGGRCWSGSVASRAASRGRRKVRRLFNGISFRLRAALLMTSQVQGRINGQIGRCWDWSSVLEEEFLTQSSHRAERDGTLFQSTCGTLLLTEMGRGS